MKVGVIARAETGRGLGVQTWEYIRHLEPAHIIVVDVGDHETFPTDFERFKVLRATVVKMAADGTLPEREMRHALRKADVWLTAETMYDWRACDWAREVGSRTVVHVNPEFYRHGQFQLPHPDGWWNPTTWRMSQLPDGTRHVPIPVALDRFPARPPRDVSRAPRFLHAVGKWAMYDRNGTETFMRACHLARRLDATIASQEPLPDPPAGDWVKVRVGGTPNYWEAYDGYDVLVMPRRYGGLCLPAQEAMAAGLAVVMPAVSPNQECWPVVPIYARSTGRVPLPAGWVELAETDANALAGTMLQLADDPKYLASSKARSVEWAEEHAWPRMVDFYREQLAAVIAGPAPAPRPRADQGHNPFAARS